MAHSLNCQQNIGVIHGGHCFLMVVFCSSSGWVTFGFLAFVAFTWVLCGFCGFSFRILCIHTSSLFVFVGSCGFCGFGFSHPLHCQFRCVWWLFGFVAFGGFLALAFRILCFPSLFLALASCILSIASSSLAPPPLAIKMHDHYATATF